MTPSPRYSRDETLNAMPKTGSSTSPAMAPQNWIAQYRCPADVAPMLTM
jgi:hypothetical protein